MIGVKIDRSLVLMPIAILLIAGIGLAARRLLPLPASQIVQVQGEFRHVERWQRKYRILPPGRWGLSNDVIAARGRTGSCRFDRLVLGFFEVVDIRESRFHRPPPSLRSLTRSSAARSPDGPSNSGDFSRSPEQGAAVAARDP
jgi:hypothetical protein